MSTHNIFETWRYTLYPHKETKWFPENALQLTSNLLQAFDSVLFTIEAGAGFALTRVRDLGPALHKLEAGLFQNIYPTLHVRSEQNLSLPLEEGFPLYMTRLPFKLWNAAEIPLLYVDEIRAEADPLSTLYQAFNTLKGNETALVSLFVHRRNKPLFHKANTLMTVFKNIKEEQDRTTYVRRKSTYEQIREGKQLASWYECFLVMDIYAHSADRAVELAQVMSPVFENFRRDELGQPSNGLRLAAAGVGTYHLENEDAVMYNSFLDMVDAYMEGGAATKKEMDQYKIYLTEREIAALWHIPHQDFTAVNVEWIPEIPQAPATLVENSEGLLFGGALHDWEMKAVRLLDRDRAHHINILGRSGTGKSTLLHNLITADIEAGKGVCVIDPHGKLIQDILRSSIPEQREADVVLLDFSQNDYPVPLNIFASTAQHTAIGRIVDMIESMAPANTTGVRTEKYLREAIKLLQHHRNATMLDIAHLFQKTEFRQSLLDALPADAFTIRTFWQMNYDNIPNQHYQIYEPVLSRIEPFIGNDYLLPSLCHPDCVNFAEHIAKKRIILINLGMKRELVPEKERNLVGSMLISLLQFVGMRAYEASNSDGHPEPIYYAYVDEVQHFVTTSLDTIFSEARKYGLAMTVAHQFLGQLNADTVKAVMSNVGTTVCFRCGVEDGRALAPYMAPQFDLQKLVNLDMHQTAVKMQLRGRTMDAFLMFPFPPPDIPEDASERQQRIRQKARQNFMQMSKSDVMSWLMTRLTPNPKTDDISLKKDDDEFHAGFVEKP